MKKIVIGCVFHDDPGMMYIPGWDMEPYRLDRKVEFMESSCAIVTAFISDEGIRFHKFITATDTPDVANYVSCCREDGFSVLRGEFCDGYPSVEMYFPRLDRFVERTLLPHYYIYPTKKVKDKIHAPKHRASKLTVSRIPPERMERIRHLSTGTHHISRMLIGCFLSSGTSLLISEGGRWAG